MFAGQQDLNPSENDYDWLGPGVYFWEADAPRALAWAQQQAARKGWGDVAVVGAVIDLGNCLDLTRSDDHAIVRAAYRLLEAASVQQQVELPRNRDIRSDPNGDRLLRNLDCAVIREVHKLMEAKGLEPFDTVRSTFQEGAPLYPGAEFKERTHTQIAVRTLSSIRGYFRPRPAAPPSA